MRDRHTIDTPGARFDISVVASGEIEIYTPDGEILSQSRSNNVVRLQCVPSWDDETAIKVVSHIITQDGDSYEQASRIVSALRGRTNVNKHRQQQGE